MSTFFRHFRHDSSGTFTVNPGALYQFVFSTIGTQTSGTVFNVAITAEDQYGNTVNLNQAETLLHNVSGGTGTPTLSPTSVAFTNGVATPSVTITCSGTHTDICTLTATKTKSPATNLVFSRFLFPKLM